jgi:hypothetical protein
MTKQLMSTRSWKSEQNFFPEANSEKKYENGYDQRFSRADHIHTLYTWDRGLVGFVSYLVTSERE